MAITTLDQAAAGAKPAGYFAKSNSASLVAGRPYNPWYLAGIPSAAPVPVRSGGFGGVDGLASHIVDEKIDAVLDATHPFAARISTNAIRACAQALSKC